jgi:hypothetical protein
MRLLSLSFRDDGQSLDPALDMYAAYFSPDRPPAWKPW